MKTIKIKKWKEINKNSISLIYILFVTYFISPKKVLVGLEDMDSDIYLNSFSALTKILMKTKLKKNDNGIQIINDKTNDDIISNVGSRKNSAVNDKPQSATTEKADNSLLSVNVLINRFIIPHFIRMQISDDKEKKLESMKQVVKLWKHYILVEKVRFILF